MLVTSKQILISAKWRRRQQQQQQQQIPSLNVVLNMQQISQIIHVKVIQFSDEKWLCKFCRKSM
jgi:hypothetical protein